MALPLKKKNLETLSHSYALQQSLLNQSSVPNISFFPQIDLQKRQIHF
jgi:hypothetical protein